jgi:spoIIIJ-associated protein
MKVDVGTCLLNEPQALPAIMTNPLNDPGHAAKKIEDFLRILNKPGGLNLKPNILTGNGQVQLNSSESAGAAQPASQLTPSEKSPLISVDLSGPDTPLLLARNGELLHAIEHLAAKILRLEPEEHDLIYFDAQGFKATRNRELDMMAEIAIEKVRTTGRPFSFAPMSSHERRILHMALAKSGLPTASSGESPRRFVVLYPEGEEPVQPPTPSPEDRTRAIRNSFRRR